MTPDQVSEAKRLANEWKPMPPNFSALFDFKPEK
jgi:hypothetical protein